LVIIGGGCNGAGVYLEAVSRGLSACLIEQNDFAAGTSSKSTKLIHGGIRYLYDIFELSTQSLQSRIEKYRLLSQALSERNYFIENGYYMNK
jgi:glycerol-3-phosphate dehydrogenase